MIGTGKYNFPGIKKAGAFALKAALASTTWGAALIKGPFSGTITLIDEWIAEWLANRGLVIINLGAIYVDGEFSQDKFDKGMEEGIKNAKAPGLTDAQKKAIDDQVIKAFRPFALIANKPTK